MKAHKKQNKFINLYSNRTFLVLIIIIVASASFAIGFTMATTPIVGSFPVYSGSGDIWNPSGTASSGIIIDGNTLCFPSATICDKNVTWNGVDFIING